MLVGRQVVTGRGIEWSSIASSSPRATPPPNGHPHGSLSPVLTPIEYGWGSRIGIHVSSCSPRGGEASKPDSSRQGEPRLVRPRYPSEEGRPARLRWLHIVEDSALTNRGHHVGKGDWRRPYLQLVCVLSLTPDLAHWDKVPGRAAFPMGESAPLPSGASGQGQHAGGPCATCHFYP